MKSIVCIAVAIVIDTPDGDSPVCPRKPVDPLDELTARLRREARFGRDSIREESTLPERTAWMAAAYQEC